MRRKEIGPEAGSLPSSLMRHHGGLWYNNEGKCPRIAIKQMTEKNRSHPSLLLCYVKPPMPASPKETTSRTLQDRSE